jgi:hypothetical protein
MTETYGNVQWKGTDVCIDIQCQCGHHSHYDGYFAYYIQCPGCKIIFELSSHIRMEPVENPDEEIMNLCRKPDLEEEE